MTASRSPEANRAANRPTNTSASASASASNLAHSKACKKTTSTSSINRKKELERIERENAILARKLNAVRKEPPANFHAPDGKLTLHNAPLTQIERDRQVKKCWPLKVESKQAIRQRANQLDKALEDRSLARRLAKVYGEVRDPIALRDAEQRAALLTGNKPKRPLSATPRRKTAVHFDT